MPSYIPLQPSRHRQAGFRRPDNFAHIQTEQFAPVLLEEISHLMPLAPLCFTRGAEEDARFELVVLQGVEPGVNLCVDPHSHKWLLPYTPAHYRSYPFSIGTDMGTGQNILCIDQESDLIVEEPGAEDLRFFAEDGQLSQIMKDTLAFMEQCNASRKQTQAAVDLLVEMDLLMEWPVTLSRLGVKIAVDGLYRVDPAKFKVLDAEQLKRLQDVYGLLVVYGQLFSEQRLRTLARLDSYHLSGAKQAPSQDPLDDIWTPDEGDISFDLN